jgi:GTPase
VFGELGADGVKELMVFNKADLADPDVLARLVRREPHSIVVSARTGEGIEELLAAIERDLPRPEVELEALIPYERGDLVARIHASGEMLKEEHTDHGTLVRALIHPELAAALEPFRTVAAQ